MAHFARIENNIVTNVIVISNNDCPGDFPDSEPIGQAFIAGLGLEGEWKQTSYNASFRGLFAGIGFTFDGSNFIPPQPYPSWVLDGLFWVPPIPYPNYEARWDESTQSWVAI